MNILHIFLRGVRALTAFVFCVSAPNAFGADFTVVATFPTYTINGTGNPGLTLLRGTTYTFSVNATGHPFYIKTNQVNTTSDAYNNGVTGNGVQNGTLTFAVPTNASPP